ncbi:MAG: helix-turn-helix transcriptional regulator [Spirochaetales bacterium]|nr:helix-turn-helix transcriptional regulator [Spirochaetales bacterium]
MIRAYRETYLSKAQSLLGDAFDYAVNVFGVPGDVFVKIFIANPICTRLENGDPSCVAAKNGIEIAAEIIADALGEKKQIEIEPRLGRSEEYWIGWAVAYYQWYSDRKFSEIFKIYSFDDLKVLYHPLHEADISKFVEITEARIKSVFPETNLKRIRTAYGCSQAELAEMSGVGLRSIQMYEQRNKDINKASAESLLRISKVLGCRIEDLIEK